MSDNAGVLEHESDQHEPYPVTQTAVLLKNRGVLAVGGNDARTFLQDLVTNDVDHLTADHALYAALLSPQGKYLFDFFIVGHGDTLMLDTGRARLPDLLKRLMMYKLRADVTLEDQSDQWTVAALFPAPDKALATGITFTDPRENGLGARALLPSGQAEPLLKEAGFSLAGEDTYDAHRIALGVPDSNDFIIDKTLALEGNLDALNAVSFKKGCYVGQELTARTKYRGNVKRRLYPVRIDGTAPAPEAEVQLGDKVAGQIRSAVDGRGIALLRIEDVEKAAESGTPFTVGNATVAVVVP